MLFRSDFLCCYNSQFIAIEAKAGKGKATALQLKELEAIKRTGGLAWLVNEDNLSVLEDYFKGESHE